MRRDFDRVYLTRRGAVAVTIPIENRFAESGSRRDDCDIFFGMIDAAIEIQEIFWLQFLQAAGGGDQIVHQDDMFTRQAKTGSERSGVKHPGNVSGVEPAIDYGSGNAKPCAGDSIRRG